MATNVTEIDIEPIIKERLGSKSKYIPHFVFSGIEKLIHQDFINGYLRQKREGVDFCEGALDYLDVTVDVEGIENLPDLSAGYCTFVCNHPLGAIDGVTLGAVLGRHYNGQIKYLVNDFLMSLSGLAPLCVPVNKLGGQHRNLPQMVDAAFGGDNHVIMFPAGLCSRRINGIIRDLPWQKAFIVKSCAHQRNVVPIRFIGENSARFYAVANFCQRFRLPNFAMALLPDEMYRSRGRHYTVRIGCPIPWQTFDASRTPKEWAAYVQEEVYKI